VSVAGAWRSRLRRRWQRVADAVSPPPLILMYHRIARDAIDPWQLCVSPRNFEAQMAWLRRERRPLRLAQLVDALAQGRVPRNAVVVTFDDGYRDNLEVALPVLERFDVPATVFCTTDAIGCKDGFWWDRLAALLLAPHRLPSELALDVGVERRRFEPGPAAHHDVAGMRLAFYREVWAALRPLADADRAAALETIATWCGVEAASTPTTLTNAELRTLSASDLIDIGAHSKTHATLSTLPPDAQHAEIMQSKTQLETLTGRAVSSFAYPFGNQGAETARLVRDAGFRAACTTEAAAVRAGADPFQLPRMAVGDWNAATLAGLWRR
jgi:peptidoglycan/xylan/chitin deacetylase (PgdA/CDA1 family)